MVRTLLDLQKPDVLCGDAETAESCRVRCPVHARTVAFDECLSCTESGGLARDPAGRIEYARCRRTGAGAEARREDAVREE